MRDKARPRDRAAMLCVEKAIKDEVPTPAAIIPPSGNKGKTKKEAVTLPKFQGAEKPGAASPFLTFPVWLRNWNEHIGDYEEKSHSKHVTFTP